MAHRNCMLFNEKMNSFCVVDLLFIVTCTHQKIEALLCCINYDYTANIVKKILFINFFLLSIEKRKEKYQGSQGFLNFLNCS